MYKFWVLHTILTVWNVSFFSFLIRLQPIDKPESTTQKCQLCKCTFYSNSAILILQHFNSVSHIIESHQRNPLVLIDSQSNTKDTTKLTYPMKPYPHWWHAESQLEENILTHCVFKTRVYRPFESYPRASIAIRDPVNQSSCYASLHCWPCREKAALTPRWVFFPNKFFNVHLVQSMENNAQGKNFCSLWKQVDKNNLSAKIESCFNNKMLHVFHNGFSRPQCHQGPTNWFIYIVVNK